MKRAIAEFEDSAFETNKLDQSEQSKAPEGSPEDLLKLHIDKLTAEVETLQSDLEASKKESKQLLEDKDALVVALAAKKKEVEDVTRESRAAEADAAVFEMAAARRKEEEAQAAVNKSALQDSEDAVDSLKAQVDALKGEVADLTADLESRLTASKPFQNLKQMVQSKNGLIKAYKQRLLEFISEDELPGVHQGGSDV